MSSFMKAKLTSPTKINVAIFSNLPVSSQFKFELYVDSQIQENLKLVKRSSMNSLYIFELEMSKPFEYGRRYDVSLTNFGIESVDISVATSFPDFDKKFFYNGDDLGAIYSKEETKFALWSPISDRVVVNIENENQKFDMYIMTRDSKGVFRYTYKGDLKNRNYYYGVRSNGVLRNTNDPYGKGTSLNSKYSTVIDLTELEQIKKIPSTNKIENLVDAVIYEVNVRDFTEDKHTNIKEKGKYLGMVEANRKTPKGNPAGLDYLKYLSINAVQLQPLHDFRGVQDDNPLISYNWGYDPISYFAIEGSYSSHPEDPIARLKELRTMVSELHKCGISVIVDVVYNHIYEHGTSILEKSCPGYYFRKKASGEVCCTSGCGNDIATEKLMMRKMIIDSLYYLVDTFDIDGFRFDLMGLIDIETIKSAYRKLKTIKKNIIFYGEGWNMCDVLPMEDMACSENASKLPNVGFFNEMFRDIVKGSSMRDKLAEKGFINGNIDYHYGLEFVFNGSVVKKSYNPRYLSANQTINYVECHDNSTLYDKLCVSNSDEKEETILKRVNLASAITIASFGVPLIHMGQEFGQSKKGHDNTYNVPVINNMRWDLVDERWDMVSNVRTYIRFRFEIFNYTHDDKPKSINGRFTCARWDNNLICLFSKKDNNFKNYKNALIIINATNEIQMYTNDDNLDLMNLTDINQGIKPHYIAPITIQFLGEKVKK